MRTVGRILFAILVCIPAVLLFMTTLTTLRFIPGASSFGWQLDYGLVFFRYPIADWIIMICSATTVICSCLFVFNHRRKRVAVILGSTALGFVLIGILMPIMVHFWKN